MTAIRTRGIALSDTHHHTEGLVPDMPDPLGNFVAVAILILG